MHTLITAHSGSDGRPDNSLEYVEYALGCGADALEIDVRRGANGFYISHDQAAGEAPDLKDVFALVGRGTSAINCDLKQADMEQDVLALAKEYALENRLIFSGTVSCQALDDAEIAKRTYWNIESALPELEERYHQGIMPDTDDVRRAVDLYNEKNVRVINVHYALCTPENLRIFRDGGIGVSAWTVDDEAEAKRLLAAGIVNITTRKSGMLCALRKSICNCQQ